MGKVSREDVYAAIDSERAYQDVASAEHIRPGLTLGEHLLSMEYNMARARVAWYQGQPPHPSALEFVRKVAAQGVAIMEEHGAPRREGF